MAKANMWEKHHVVTFRFPLRIGIDHSRRETALIPLTVGIGLLKGETA